LLRRYARLIYATVILLGVNFVLMAIFGLITARSGESRTEIDALHIQQEALEEERSAFTISVAISFIGACFVDRGRGLPSAGSPADDLFLIRQPSDHPAVLLASTINIPRTGQSREIRMSGVANTSDTHGKLIAATKVNGTTVYDTVGEKLGSVYDIMLDKTSGKADYAIMSFGGFLGIGERYHPLPWDHLTYDESKGGYVVNVDRTQLEGAPSYSADEDYWTTDPTYGQRIDDYYGPMTR
jgi:sporulation protein YlmC with PRC-barrel domain